MNDDELYVCFECCAPINPRTLQCLRGRYYCKGCLPQGFKSRWDFAREMRARPTRDERALTVLANEVGGAFGVSFQPQVVIGRFIADLYSEELKLAIEVDGASHRIAKQMKRDAAKETELRALGVRLLRFPNGVPRFSPNRIRASLRNSIRFLKGQLLSP